ncbi:MAG: DUF3857 domain-containing protein [Ferruginibacter sp.]
MKTAFLSITFLFVCTSLLFAQKELPAFGKIDKADLEMTDCEFDKGAEALTLINWGKMYYERGIPGVSFLNTVYEYRVRIKVLKESGLSYANVNIPYYDHNNEEKIIKIDASTYNLDASGKIKTTDVSKSSIYSKRINKFYSEMIIAFPEVKVGSIVEYKYKMERRTDQHLKGWDFQDKIPVRYSEYQINIPLFYHFSVNPNIVDEIEVKEKVYEDLIATNEGTLTTETLQKNFIMRNLIGIKAEPFMGAVKDYQQGLEFQLSTIDYGGGRTLDLRTTWADVIKDLMKDDDFGKQLEWEPKGTTAMISEAKQLTDEESRMKFILNYVKKNMTWDDDESIYSYDGINSAFEKKTGSTGDINLLLTCLLNKAGIKAYPILFSTRNNGLVKKAFPFISQFNIVMVYVTVAGKYFVLDATDKVIHYRLVPQKVVNTNGFIVEGENGRWVEILSGKSKYKVMAAVQGEITADGILKGSCLVNCYDYARVQRCESWVENKEKFKDDYFIKPYSFCKIEDLAINNTEADSLPLEQKVKFSSVLNSSGDYRYFNINLFSDLDRNPFVAADRVSDVDFGFLQDYTIFGNYSIPPDYIFDGLPENISMTTPDNGIIFNRSMQVEANLLNVRMTVEFKRSFYTAASYAEFKEFYKKLFDKLNEQVVIKKKATL